MTARDELIAALGKDFAPLLDRTEVGPQAPDFLSTGILSLDHCLGGGVPRGHLTHFYGPDGGGKTTTMISLVIQAQQHPVINGQALYVATEPKVDTRLFDSHGVDLNALHFAKSRYGGPVLDGNVAMDMIEKALGLVDLIVLDSVAALAVRVGFDSDSDSIIIGAVAKLLSYRLPYIAQKLATTKTALVFLNQARDSFARMPGSMTVPVKPYAGRAIRHFDAVRGKIVRTGDIKRGKTVVGFRPKLTTEKNDFAPKASATWSLYFDTGVDAANDAIDFAKSAGIVQYRNGWWVGDVALNHDGEKKWDDAVTRLREEPELFARLREAVMATRVDGAVDDDDVEEAGEE